MNVENAIDELERASSAKQARQILNQLTDPESFAEIYFARLLSIAGERPTAAVALSNHWKEVGIRSARLDYGYRAKAVGERIQGKWAQSAKSFQKSGEIALNPVDKLSFQAGAVDSLARAGQVSQAVRLGHRLALRLDGLGQKGLAARVRLNVGNALVWADSYDRAKRWLAEAIPDLESAGFHMEAAAARLALSTAELYGPEPGKAKDHAEEARKFFDANGMHYYGDLCLINLAHDALLKGRPDEGLTMLLDVRDRLSSSPVDAARIEEYLGDAYIKLNLYEEAIDSYRTAKTLQHGKDMPLNGANCEYGEAQALLLQGEFRQAVRAFNSAAKRYQGIQNRVWAAAARLGAASANRLLGRTMTARDEVVACVKEFTLTRSRFHLVSALLEASKLAANGPASSATLTRASELIRNHGYVAQEWELHAARARTAAGGRKTSRYREAFQSMLSARMLTRSDLARTRFLRDKGDFLADYIKHLLARPTKASVQEAIEVIVESRSAALIDEIMSASPALIRAEDGARMRQLREELSAAASDDFPGSFERLAPFGVAGARDLGRCWLETTAHFLETVTAKRKSRDLASTTIYAEAGPDLFRIQDGGSHRLASTRDEILRRLRWLEFEMLAPMVDPGADSGPILRELDSLTLEFGTAREISPDGVLWRMPWQAFAQSGSQEEPILLASPAFGAGAGEKRLNPDSRVGIWYFEGDQLPHVFQEVQLLLKKFPNAEICRTATEVREHLDHADYDLLHVAGHARFNRENPMFSFLQFADDKIYAAEIAKSKMRAKFVVLSACETGSLAFACKEEPEGLTRAFLARSAEAVLASAWAVNDESALRFMETFYGQFSQGSELATAVSHGRAACREWKAHPYYWAPFVVFGGYCA